MNSDKPFTFAERLQYIMDTMNLSKSDIAKMCGVHKSNITRYCNGGYEAKQDVIYRLASKLHVSEPWLMGYDVPMFPDLQNEKEPTVNNSGLDELEIQLMHYIKNLNYDQKKFLLAQLQTLTANQGETR